MRGKNSLVPPFWGSAGGKIETHSPILGDVEGVTLPHFGGSKMQCNKH